MTLTRELLNRLFMLLTSSRYRARVLIYTSIYIHRLYGIGRRHAYGFRFVRGEFFSFITSHIVTSVSRFQTDFTSPSLSNRPPVVRRPFSKLCSSCHKTKTLSFDFQTSYFFPRRVVWYWNKLAKMFFRFLFSMFRLRATPVYTIKLICIWWILDCDYKYRLMWLEI